MKAFLVACAVAIVVAVASVFVLDGMQQSADAVYSTTGVRL